MKKNLTPTDGVETPLIAPPDGVGSFATTPPDGAMKALFDPLPTPPDGDHLEKPYTVATARVTVEAMATINIGIINKIDIGKNGRQAIKFNFGG